MDDRAAGRGSARPTWRWLPSTWGSACASRDRIPRRSTTAWRAPRPGAGRRPDAVRPFRASTTRACTAASPTGSPRTPRASPSAPSGRSPASGSSSATSSTTSPTPTTSSGGRRSQIAAGRALAASSSATTTSTAAATRPTRSCAPRRSVHVGVSYRRDRFESMPVVADDAVFFFKREPRPNPEVEEGERDVVLLTARWAAGGPLYATPGGGARLLPGRATSTASGSAATRTSASTPRSSSAGETRRRRRLLSSVHRPLARTPRPHDDASPWTAGCSSASARDLPPQRRFALGGVGHPPRLLAQDVRRRRPGAGHGRRPPPSVLALARPHRVLRRRRGLDERGRPATVGATTSAWASNGRAAARGACASTARTPSGLRARARTARACTRRRPPLLMRLAALAAALLLLACGGASPSGRERLRARPRREAAPSRGGPRPLHLRHRLEVRDDLDESGAVKERRSRRYETFFVLGRPVRRLVEEDGRPLSATRAGARGPQGARDGGGGARRTRGVRASGRAAVRDPRIATTSARSGARTWRAGRDRPRVHAAGRGTRRSRTIASSAGSSGRLWVDEAEQKSCARSWPTSRP